MEASESHQPASRRSHTGKDQLYMALGLLLAGLVPTSGMTISWTGLARGNMAAAVKMTVIGLTLGALATPLYAQVQSAAWYVKFTSLQVEDFNLLYLAAGIGAAKGFRTFGRMAAITC